MMQALKHAPLTERHILNSTLNNGNFKEWIFCPGMLFKAENKWWGDFGKRLRPHEGLDLCMYRDKQEKISRLDERTLIPAMYNGVVVEIINDYLGKSVLIEHNVSGNDPLCIIYSHIDPVQGLKVRSTVKEGEIIASLSPAGKSKTGLLPHLHISAGIINKDISYDRLDWNNIINPDIFTLINPLKQIGRHQIVNNIEVELR